MSTQEKESNGFDGMGKGKKNNGKKKELTEGTEEEKI